ncbi:MAG: DUF4258 domain-containing protein [Chitinophagaceae bacterium]|nr:DUF4258 domain-containing protein [Chitinophagaceae bacterium]
MNLKKLFPFIFIAILAIAAIALQKCGTEKSSNTKSEIKTSRGLNRNPAKINYSKHAECRMECRTITKTEVKQVLTDGKINYKKSDLNKSDCIKRYAVDGYSKDGQHIRIVVAPCADELTVITCIDLDKDWECNCENDE